MCARNKFPLHTTQSLRYCVYQTQVRLWRNGRRAALRSLWGKTRGGSSPLSRTNLLRQLIDIPWLFTIKGHHHVTHSVHTLSFWHLLLQPPCSKACSKNLWQSHQASPIILSFRGRSIRNSSE